MQPTSNGKFPSAHWFLPIDEWRYDPSIPLIIIGRESYGKCVAAMWSENRLKIQQVPSYVVSTEYAHEVFPREDLFMLALEAGRLYIPERPLLLRETTGEGCPNCWNCKQNGHSVPLGFSRKSFGCDLCRKNGVSSYVCLACGNCIAGYDGYNWRGERFPPQKFHPFDTAERSWYVFFASQLDPRKESEK